MFSGKNCQLNLFLFIFVMRFSIGLTKAQSIFVDYQIKLIS